ncbi:hypothetical protein HID58_072804 [Brassica napus]|uniref:Uncharacterized protein n=1 Tax=Brassica napus TaxID=3708 RepID=A0ABQ7Z5F9_BRANA|nr:hypothetical protein HID58_072804 [Brassica napus]
MILLREDVLGDRCSVSARNPPPARSDHSGFTLPPFVSSVPEYASVDFDQRRETEESSLGMVSLDRFYGYESSFPVSSHFEQETMVWYQSVHTHMEASCPPLDHLVPEDLRIPFTSSRPSLQLCEVQPWKVPVLEEDHYSQRKKLDD